MDRATEAELLAAVVATPDDDAPRLVYADWLAPHDPARAELIQVQCALAKATADHDDDGDGPSVAGLRRRERELFDAHGSTWLDLGVLGAGIKYSRGFPDTLHGVPEGMRELGDTVATRLPLVRDLEITLFESEVVPILAEAPVLARIQRLYLSSGGSNIRFGALGQVPALAGLEELSFSSMAIAPAELEAIVTSPVLRRLRALSIDTTARYLRGATRGMARATVPLEEVTIAGAHAGPPLGLGLATAPGITRLRRLEIPWNELGAGAVAALVASGRLDDVEVLDLAGNELDPTALEGLLARPLHKLRRLRLGGNPALGDDGAALIAAWPRAAQLVELRLGGSAVAGAGARALASSPHLVALRTLVLSGIPLGAEREAELLASPALAKARIYVGAEGQRARMLARKAAARAAAKAARPRR